jgi:hypothetical protein
MREKSTVPNTPGTFCGGERLLAQCETTQAMLKESGGVNVGLKGDQHSLWTRLAYLSRTCIECGNLCDIELESIDSQTTGEVRFTFTKSN